MFRRTERLFHRYQQTGEPRLLGLVFDRTAAELLRVALHLTRDRHRAEDLVQSTFLTAIEKGAQYDAARPLLPWLLEILANHARQVYRREKRVLAVPAQAGEGGDVGDTAAARELAATCDRAIDALAEPYRHVLILHLRHGLSGQEIAATLARPDSTVRNQIARGLDLLRRKLPASLTAALAIGAVGGRGLAAVRSAVLARVPVPVGGVAAVAVAGPFFGVLLMGHKVVGSLVLLAVVAGGAWYSGVFADPAMALPNRDARVASSPAAEPTTGTTEPPTVHREAAGQTPAEATTGSLHATLVVEGDGTPVADAACSVWKRTEDAPLRLVAQAVTQLDGTLGLTLAPGTFELEVDVSGHQENFTIAAGAETRLRCEVDRGSRLEGVVVDTDGHPVGGAEVRRARQWSSVLLARTAADGTFAVEHVRGTLLLWAVGPRRQPAKRQSLDVRRDTTGVRLVLGGPGTPLSGRVVDEHGEAAANARVFIGLDTKDGSSTFVIFELHDLRAGDVGRFAVDWLAPGRVCVAAVPSDQDLARTTLRELVVEDGVPVQVTLQLGDGARVAGIVRGEDGQPIAGAELDASWGHSGLDLLGRPSAKTGPDGRFEVRGLLPGQNWLSVRRGGMSIDTSIDLERGQTLEWNPVLGKGAPIAIRVLGPDDEPLAHRSVSIDVGGSPKAYGGTNEEGRWRFESMPLVEHTLKVYAADHAVVLAQRTLMPGPEEVLIRIDAAELPSARITGRVVDARGTPVVDCQVMMTANSSFVQPQHVDREGRFKTELLPPGHYGISAQAKTAGLGWAFASATLVAKEVRDVGDIVLPVTASVAIRLRAADGSKVRDALLRLGYPRETASAPEYLTADEVDGVYRQTGLNPGQYVLRLLAPDAVPQSVPLTLGAGERREIDLVAERGVPVTLELRCRLDPPQNGRVDCQLSLTDARGERVVFHRLWDYCDDLDQHIKRVHLGLLPGTYRVHIEEFGGRKKELEIVVPTAAPAAPIVIDLR